MPPVTPSKLAKTGPFTLCRMQLRRSVNITSLDPRVRDASCTGLSVTTRSAGNVCTGKLAEEDLLENHPIKVAYREVHDGVRGREEG